MRRRVQGIAIAGRKLARELVNVGRHAPAGVTARFVANLALALPAIAREGTLAPADRRFGDAPIELPSASLRWPGRHFGLIRELVFRRVYEARPGFEVVHGDVVVDLGANCGLFTCMAAARGARVVAIEAQRGFIEEIEQNAALNGLSARVTPVWAMVHGDHGVFASADVRQRASHMRGLEPPDRELSEILDAHGIDRVDLLKMDIEGSEFGLFAAPGAWLGRVRRIVAEVHAGHGDARALMGRIRDAGFDVTRLDADLLEADPPWDAPSQFFFCARRDA